MRKTCLLVTASFAAIAAPAFAQDNSTPAPEASPVQEAAPEAPAPDDQEIIITAQGRSQVLQDVPLAVTAISSETMQNSGATDIRQLNQLAPSLLVSSTGTEANGSARIRGIGTVGDNPGLESSVAAFIDGVYRSRSGIGLNELGEIERVEVLRGPQGTLFGRNASAGLIHVISKKPNMTEFEGYGEATYGNYDQIRAGLGLTGPISTGVGFRLDAVYSKRDGFMKDVLSGDRVNDRNRYFLRGQLLFEPNDDIDVRLIADYTRRNEDCCGAVYIDLREKQDATPGTPGDFVIAPNNRIVDVMTSMGAVFPSAGDPYNRLIATTPGRGFDNVTKDYGFSGQVDWNLGFGSLTSITAYRYYKSGGEADIDYGNLDIAYRGEDSFRRFRTFSQELRLQGSAFNDKLDWLVGAYYANEKLRVVDDLKFGTQYGAFAACRLVATLNPTAALRNPANPGCLSPTGRAVLTGAAPGTTPAFGPFTPAIVAGIDRLSTLNNLGDANAVYDQRSRNYAFFTHNIINFSDQLSLTLGARYTNEKKRLVADFNNTNTICDTQRASLLPVLQASQTTPGLTPAQRAQFATAIGGIIQLTCTGNSAASLNGLDIRSRKSEDEITGTAVVSWKPSADTMVYASYSRGYKAGGFNLDRSDFNTSTETPFLRPITNADADNLQFAPEIVDAFEIGTKISGRGLTFNVAAFYQMFKDFQLNTFNGSAFIVQNVNGCKDGLGGADQDPSRTTGTCDPDRSRAGVTSKGIELEASYRWGRDLNLTLGYTYADTKYRRNLVGSSEGEALDPALFLLAGQNMSNAPEHTVTGSIGWSPQLGTSGLRGLVYVDARRSSGFNTGSDLFPEKEQDGFAVVNGRIGIRGPDERWGVEVWAQNLFNKGYQQVAFNAPFQGSNSVAHVQRFGAAQGFGVANQIFTSYLAEPRTYGITARMRF